MDKQIRKNQIYLRSKRLYITFLLCAVAIIVKIFIIQYGVDGDALREEAQSDVSFKARRIPALRGDIFSHDHRTLATTIPMFSVHMDFKAGGMTDSLFNTHVDSLASSLSGFFGDRSAKQYLDLLREGKDDGKRFKRISPRRVNYIELKQILDFPLYNLGRNKGGIVLDTIFKRELPHGSLARRTIGSVNLHTGAKVGLEGYFDETLGGKDGLTATRKVSGSFWIPVDDPMNVEPEDGLDIVSTIDIEVQDVAESMLYKQLSDHDATWGTAILMEVATGEIRAIANLTKQPDGSYFEDYNYGLGMNMEPGSTWKLVSSIALLDDAKASLNDVVETGNGSARVGITTVVDTKGHGTITHREAFEVSSNIGYAKLVNRYYGSNPSRFVDYLKQIGIDQHFGVEINGEADPVIYSPKDKLWNGMTLTMMSYGYAVMMTPIHTLSIYNAIAGGGRYVAPLFVKAIEKGGKVVQEFDAKVINPQIASPSTVKQLQEVMEGVVNEGTARNILRNKHYRVAGKTGTAQVAKGRSGYHHDGGRTYLATIVGYFPAENPVYSCIVAIETFRPDGSGKTYYGGSLSGPVFRAIADKVYAQAVDWGVNVAKPTTLPSSYNTPAKRYTHREYLKEGDRASLDMVLSELDIASRVKTRRDTLAKADPAKLCNVVGMGLSDAVYLLEAQGCHVSVEGLGSVVRQSLPPGTPLTHGDSVTIFLKN